MKILLFLTGFRQLEEYHYFNQFLQRLKIRDQCDLYIYCNNPEIDPKIIQYYQEFDMPRKQLYLTTLNGGYRIGGVEAVSQGIDMGLFQNYDYVLHMHPDVFMTDEAFLTKLLQDNLTNDIVFFISQTFPDDQAMFAFDFFFFKPRLLKSNIFRDELYTFTEPPEKYLSRMLFQHQIPFAIIPRYKNRNWFPRRIDDFLGLYHEHDLDKVQQTLQELSNNGDN